MDVSNWNEPRQSKTVWQLVSFPIPSPPTPIWNSETVKRYFLKMKKKEKEKTQQNIFKGMINRTRNQTQEKCSASFTIYILSQTRGKGGSGARGGWGGGWVTVLDSKPHFLKKAERTKANWT